ncbi:MAG: TetR/AcrR family transcriptional regulator [Frisingicoccus sp.]|uniref:TetR/AcrR family transcriptional regulator n=1 Tax=Frisingicoccus sp. TaxID=1918627 RepID=UPI002606795E|nr:TetR/AcrR family transcriptional regulator [Frisingicoccus sp.]MDD6233106.1 TetR/AcrR family transcriptional regulator [Frisingicoccus sp.]MDY4833923.1 TetR/AcrR family transcriptional regulator [Frisingicoccus sp.]
MSTKERILNEALRLFSEKGYSDVYVSDIAEAVGIKAPSLYKHYKGKQEIFDSCVEKFYERMTQVRNDLLLPDTLQSELSYETIDTNQIIEFAIGLFMFYWKDEVASGFRRMLMLERYRNQDLNKIYEDLFVNGAVQHEETIFSSLITAGVIKKVDSHVAALRFYTPIYYLLQKYDMHPDQEEDAKKELVSMVTEFCETYKG